MSSVILKDVLVTDATSYDPPIEDTRFNGVIYTWNPHLLAIDRSTAHRRANETNKPVYHHFNHSLEAVCKADCVTIYPDDPYAHLHFQSETENPQ